MLCGHDGGPSSLMHRYNLGCLLATILSPCLVAAQFPSPNVNLTTVRSPVNGDVTISYKSPDGACRTAFESQKQYTGWVNVPGDYPTNLFFWFIEARQQTDLLTIWLNGGPGSTSLFGMFAGVGPCEVFEKGGGLNEYETLVNEWGWDRASNMLFIDQVGRFQSVAFRARLADDHPCSPVKSASPTIRPRTDP